MSFYALFPSYSAVLREIKPMLQALPKPLASQHPRQEQQAVITQPNPDLTNKQTNLTNFLR